MRQTEAIIGEDVSSVNTIQVPTRMGIEMCLVCLGALKAQYNLQGKSKILLYLEQHLLTKGS